MAGLLHLHDQGAWIVIQAHLVADPQDAVRVVRLDARQKASQRERLQLSGHDLSFSFLYTYVAVRWTGAAGAFLTELWRGRTPAACPSCFRRTPRKHDGQAAE